MSLYDLYWRFLRFARKITFPTIKESAMSKGMDRKKQAKKQPAKTMLQKRTEKRAKKAARGGMA